MAVAEVLSGPQPESFHRTKLRRAIIASTVGTTIEWYDLLLYSVVTGLVFAKLFFPKSDPLVGLLEAFAVYMVGFIARPIGAAIFGHYGDRIGRRNEGHGEGGESGKQQGRNQGPFKRIGALLWMTLPHIPPTW
jgi:MFS family permease